MPDWRLLFRALREDAISIADNASPRPVGGGDISAAWRIDTDDAAVFVKTGPGNLLDMFEAEAEGLRELLAVKAVRVPDVLGCGVTAEGAYADKCSRSAVSFCRSAEASASALACSAARAATSSSEAKASSAIASR